MSLRARRPTTSVVALVALAITALAGCGNSSSTTASAQRWPDPDWQVSDPASEGLDPATLDGARTYAFQPAKHTQGVVVVKNGAIVAEWYADGDDASTLATSWSAAKSFSSTLIGIAIDQGKLPGIDIPMDQFFPAWKGDDRSAISLHSLLEMRSGLQWNEALDDAQFHINTPDQLTTSAERPAARPPGTQFNYSSADSMLLSGVIEQSTGEIAGDFAQQNLFGPIGMNAEWWTDAAGNTLTYCCIDTTTRDFARFGLLFARGGKWRDKQVVSKDWVDLATHPDPGLPFYALQWWTDVQGLVVNGAPAELFTARGLDSQNIYVFPSLDLVVVRNGIYHRIGDRAVREGNNLLTTLSPDSWDDVAFLGPVLRAIDPAAETSALAATQSVSGAVEGDAIAPLRAP
jgi:CubicO group peptidase (beta-lactamase class C family)